MVFGYNTSVAPREDDIVSANNTTGDITLSSDSKTIASSGGQQVQQEEATSSSSSSAKTAGLKNKTKDAEGGKLRNVEQIMSCHVYICWGMGSTHYSITRDK